MQTPEEFARGYVGRFCPAPEPCQPCLDDSGDLADLIRERDAEVRVDERAKVLAGFEWETRSLNDGYAGQIGSEGGRMVHRAPTQMRRLVSPWEPTP